MIAQSRKRTWLRYVAIVAPCSPASGCYASFLAACAPFSVAPHPPVQVLYIGKAKGSTPIRSRPFCARKRTSLHSPVSGPASSEPRFVAKKAIHGFFSSLITRAAPSRSSPLPPNTEIADPCGVGYFCPEEDLNLHALTCTRP